MEGTTRSEVIRRAIKLYILLFSFELWVVAIVVLVAAYGWYILLFSFELWFVVFLVVSLLSRVLGLFLSYLSVLLFLGIMAFIICVVVGGRRLYLASLFSRLGNKC